MKDYNAVMQESEFNKASLGLPLARYEYFSSVGSTNDVVADWAREGATGLCLAYADEQIHGRGRAGRTWFTPPGSALAFSLLLDTAPKLGPVLPGLVSGLGALAVCQALEDLYELIPQIKWPNDVLLDGKKVCGVLVEMQWSGERLTAPILGIGINIAPSSLPPKKELNFPATCVQDAVGREPDAALMLRAALESLINWKDKLGDPEFVQAWDQRLAYKGHHVRLEGGGDPTVKGEILGLAADGSLQMRLASGDVKGFYMGEIQIRPLVDTSSK